MSNAFPQPSPTRDGPELHRLAVEAAPEANLLLRLLEPFVIHDVLPTRIHSAATGDALAVALEFTAPPELAARLHARLAVMVGVRAAALAPVRRGRDGAGTLAA